MITIIYYFSENHWLFSENHWLLFRNVLLFLPNESLFIGIIDYSLKSLIILMRIPSWFIEIASLITEIIDYSFDYYHDNLGYSLKFHHYCFELHHYSLKWLIIIVRIIHYFDENHWLLIEITLLFIEIVDYSLKYHNYSLELYYFSLKC